MRGLRTWLRMGAFAAVLAGGALTKAPAAPSLVEWSLGTRSGRILVPAGGALLMRPLLVHSSGKASAGARRRRVLHIEYAESTLLQAGINLASA